jgi:hypothetical protein
VVLLSNLYYDALKVVLMACTAFAVDTPEGPLHARNLDWSTQADALARHTRLVRLSRGGRLRATLVGWPGFTGCFSGVAPGRFAVTLNAVLSDDLPQLAASIVYTLRELLEEAASFREAVDELARRPIATDALLLVTGIAPGEMAVIERTPTRAAVRGPQNGVLVVTNDYRDLPIWSAGRPALGAGLAATACGRFDRACELVRPGRVQDVSAAMAVLRDPQVVLGITVQHMVLRARDGLVHVEPRLTASVA